MADVAILVAPVHQYHINAGLTNGTYHTGQMHCVLLDSRDTRLVVPPEHLVLAKSANVSKVIVAVNRMDDPAVFHMSHSHFEVLRSLRHLRFRCVFCFLSGFGQAN
jgi:translation elongation factor EF-1alpha